VLASLATRELVVLLTLREAIAAKDRDQLCEALVLLLEPSNMALYLIEAIIALEIAGTLSEGNCMRARERERC
jgi:hypothetical protein